MTTSLGANCLRSSLNILPSFSDTIIAAQALSFDGFLSKDAMAQEIYKNSSFLLEQFLAFKPPSQLGVASVQ